MRNVLLVMIFALTLGSCTTIRDTNPCNSSRLLELREKPVLNSEERNTLDSMEQRCADYQASSASNPQEPQEKISPWIRGAIIGVALLIGLILSGVIF